MHILLFACLVGLSTAIDNGRGRTPPMGWRSWNQIGASPTQAIMMAQMDAITSRARLVDGVPTSLADLQYNDVGLDDYWQL
jgi:alpha-galactosidase